MEKYKFLAHTADVKFQAFGENLEEAFFNSVLALRETIAPDTNIKEIREELEGRHVKEDAIVANMHYNEVINKLALEVKDWVKKGYTKKQIRYHLLDLNWPAMTVYEILKGFK